MFSKEFMMYLMNVDSDNIPKNEETKKELKFTSAKCLQTVPVEIRIK